MSQTMSSSRLTLHRPRRSASKKSEIEWERIMVQITFAFVIILGYLLSVGMHETQELAVEVEKHKARSDLLQGIVSELKDTEVGEARVARIAAEKKSQLEMLLRIWAEERVKRRLFSLLRQFDNAELIPLSDDIDCLPTAASFQDLGEKAAQVFLVEDQEVSVSEVARLMIVVIRRAGFDPDAVPTISELEQSASDIATLHFDQDIPTPANLRMLRLQILSDLGDERSSLGDLQYALVGKIASARRDKLANLPLPDEAQAEMEGTDLGIAMLDDVLAGLKERMQLLPEVSDRISQQQRPRQRCTSRPAFRLTSRCFSGIS